MQWTQPGRARLEGPPTCAVCRQHARNTETAATHAHQRGLLSSHRLLRSDFCVVQCAPQTGRFGTRMLAVSAFLVCWQRDSHAAAPTRHEPASTAPELMRWLVYCCRFCPFLMRSAMAVSDGPHPERAETVTWRCSVPAGGPRTESCFDRRCAYMCGMLSAHQKLGNGGGFAHHSDLDMASG